MGTCRRRRGGVSNAQRRLFVVVDYDPVAVNVSMLVFPSPTYLSLMLRCLQLDVVMQLSPNAGCAAYCEHGSPQLG